MTLTPIIVAICMNSGPTYEEACKAALSQAAGQSEIAKKFEQRTGKLERQVVEYVNPSVTMEVAASVLGYSAQLLTGNQANISIPAHRNMSLNFSVGKSSVSVGLGIDF